MNTEVVHDSVYGDYLQILAVLDKRWRLSDRIEDELANILVAALLLTAMLGYFLSVYVWVSAVCAEFVMGVAYAIYIRRLNKRYVLVSKRYLRFIAPEVSKYFPAITPVVFRRTRLMLVTEEATYHCGLRTLATTKGEDGWWVELKNEEKHHATFSDIFFWMGSRP